MAEFALQYKIGADTSGMRSANSELQKFDKNIAKVGTGKQLSGLVSSLSGVATGSQLNGLTSQLTSASGALSAIPGPAGAAVGAITLLGTVAVGTGFALYGLAKSASDYGSEIFDASEKTGLGAETLTAMKLAAEQSSSSLDEVTSGISKFSKTVGEAALGSEEAAKKLTRLGIDPQKAITDLDGALGDVFKRIAALPPGVIQSKAAMDAFGKSGADLLPFIKSFNGDLPALIAKAKELGVTMSDQDAAAADKFGDQMDTLNAQLKMLGVRIGQDVMPTFLDWSESVSDWLVRNKDEVDAWGRVTANALDMVSGSVKALKDVYDSLPPWLFTLLGGAGGALLSDALNAPRPGPTATLGDSLFKKMGKRTPPPDSDYLDNLDKQKDAADKARKERLEQAKRDNTAMIAIEQIYIKDIEAIYADSITSAERNLAAGGRITDYKQEVLDANAWLVKTAKESYGKIAALENIAAERDQKSATEQEALRQQHADRLSAIEVKTGKARLESQEKADDELGKRQEQGFQSATANINAQYDLRQAQLDLSHSVALTSEKEYQESLQKLILEEMEKQKQAMIIAGKSKAEIDLYQLKIDAQKIRSQQAVTAAEKTDAERRKKELDDLKEAADGLTKSLEEMGAAWGKALQQERANRTVGSSSAIGAMDQLREHFVGDQNTAAIAGIDALTSAFDGLGQALGSVVESWVLYGTAGASVQQVTAQILAGVAQQATVKAVFELAEGFAALAMAFFGVPNAGPSAAAHFQAAAIYGTVAGVAAIAGRGVAGNSFKQGGTASAASGGGNSSQTGGNRANSTYTRTSSDAYMSGNRQIEMLAAEVRALHQKIGSKPGEVIVADALRKRPEMAGNALVNSNARNPSIGKKFLKDSGVK